MRCGENPRTHTHARAPALTRGMAEDEVSGGGDGGALALRIHVFGTV